MLQAHSLLWNYLWPAPNVLLFILGLLMWRRRLHKQYPFFFYFALLSSVEQVTVYVTDVMPSVPPETWWRIFWVGLLVEGLLKFALIGEIFGQVFGAYASLAKLGKFLIRGVGVALVLTSALAAAYAREDSPYGLINGAHLLEQTSYLIASGLLLFIFLFSSYFRLRPTRQIFGIMLGLAISSCVHLATWAIAANAGLPAARRIVLDFVNMGTYHVCVLIWCYYLLVPAEVPTPDPPTRLRTNPAAVPSAGAGLAGDIADWNEELERLLQ
jgi:hypothetical protein